MLAVTVEVWPGGDIRRRHVIHTISVVNESDLNDISDYSVYIDGMKVQDFIGHFRKDGALALIAKILEQEGYSDHNYEKTS